ncbi:hypothetical protein [Gimesia sp.]|uniref:hypothetical protein n=1 Tax=Gimesia sp. TaxID=2024833 RepID=UPI003A8EE53A
MSDDNFYSEDNDFPPESSSQPKPGMSTGVKVLLALLGFGGICMLLCCGGLYYFAQQVGMEFTQNKARVREVQQEITDITIPDSFEPQAAMTMKVMNMRMAIYEHDPRPGELFLLSMGIADDGMLDMDKEFQRSMKNQNQQQRELNITKEEQREFNIDGEKIKFNFAEGTDKSGKEFHQVSGVFPGKLGAAFLFLQIASENYNEEEIVQMIESIRLPSKEPAENIEPEEPQPVTKPEPAVEDAKPADDQKPDTDSK